MAVANIGTHVTHCCALHGCSYGDEDCPVDSPVKATAVAQAYLCEECPSEEQARQNLLEAAEELSFILSFKNKK